MARPKSSRTGRCQGCNHAERHRIERLLAAGASIKERRGNSRLTTMHCVGTGSIMSHQTPEQPISQGLARQKISLKKSLPDAYLRCPRLEVSFLALTFAC